ncbi:hypothetical protein [Mitsuokella sp. WILCCON 0060]|uniref:hypothetical protein n=1 Tax=Mitsuokella sp. WILCCON 0060 TaxID=3345341 RepID=UPI003F1A2CCE
MKFCSKCGRHYKDSDNFCKDCGIKLTQGAADSSGLNDIKESASQALSEAGSKAKEAFSEENRQKLHDKASAAADSIKNMDAEKGKQMLNDGVSRFHSLSGLVKLVLIVAILCGIAFGGYEYFSPEKQVERAVDHSIKVMTEIGAKTPDELSDDDIEKFASLYPEEKRDLIVKGMQQGRDKAFRHPGAASKNTALKSSLIDMLADAKVKSVKIQGDRAIVTLANKNGVSLGTQPMKKVNGEWYLTDLPGDRDN